MESLGKSRVDDVGRVERELVELWASAATDGSAVVRACALNLVVVCADDPSGLAEATRAVARVSETSPGRAIVIALGADSTARGLDAYVSAHCHRRASGTLVCSEQVTLEARDAGWQLIPETVLQLLVEEMPVHLWWRREELASDPLLAALRDLSDRWIVNCSASAPSQLSKLHGLVADPARRSNADDVAWARAEPWRDAVASFFDTPETREHLDAITRVVVTAGGPASDGMPTAAAYLAGWLGSRLGWKIDRESGACRRSDDGPLILDLQCDTDLPAGRIGATRIEAERDDGKMVAFIVERAAPDSRRIRLSCEPVGAGPPPHSLELPGRDETALVCGILQRSDPDPTFVPALRAASVIARGTGRGR